jgi:hypothetical protein
MKKPLQESKLLWIFLFIAFLVSLVSADEKTDKVDKLFSKWDSTVSPGAALAIIKDGKIIYKRGYGMANLEHNIPLTQLLFSGLDQPPSSLQRHASLFLPCREKSRLMMLYENTLRNYPSTQSLSL